MDDISPKTRYECKNCGALTNTGLDIPKNKIRCCEKPNLVLLYMEENEESINKFRMQLANCYEGIIRQIEEYIDIPQDYEKVMAIWLIGTYMRSKFNTWPILFFNAMRGSGKTRTLSFLSTLGCGGNGKIVNNITEAVLFRQPKDTILCLDECENIASKDKSALREILNSNYKRGMVVKRVKKVKIGGVDQQVVETFEPDFPVCMANIAGIEEVLSDRSLTIILEKSNDPNIIRKIEDFDTNPKIQQIKRTLESLVSFMSCRYGKTEYIESWNSYINSKYPNRHNNIHNIITYNDISDTDGLISDIERDDLFNLIDNAGINGRNFELFFPLFMVAKMIGDDVFRDILRIGVDMIDGKREEEYAESRDISLYEFAALHGKNELIPLKEFTAHFKLFVGESGHDEENWVSEKWMGRALKRLQLTKFKKREASGRMVLIDIEKAKEKLKIFKR